MSTPTLNIGLIGAGRIGRLHAGHLAGQIPGARLAAVADVQLAAAREVAVGCGAPLATADYGDLLADPAIDAVLIAAATDTHATIIAAAAAAGKHIFCEKPIALSLAAIDGALAAVERAGVKLQIGFNRRFDANYRRVREAIVAGEIGRPELLHIVSRDPAPPPPAYLATSGGLFLDMTIHDFDMARFLLGGEVTAVFATASALTDPGVAAASDVDTAVVVLTFADGAIGTIENSRRAVYGYDQRVEILGSAGAIAIGNDHPNTAIISDRGGVRRDPPLHFFMERYLASYRAELSAFVDSIRYDRPTQINGLDGRLPVVLGLAAERSRREGRVVRPAEVEQDAALPTPV